MTYLLSSRVLDSWGRALDWERRLGLEEGEFLYPYFMIQRYLHSFDGWGKRSRRAARERTKADIAFLQHRLEERVDTSEFATGRQTAGIAARALLDWWRDVLRKAGKKWYPVSQDLLPVCTGRALQRLTDEAVTQWVLQQPGFQRRSPVGPPGSLPRPKPSGPARLEWEILPPPRDDRVERLALLADLRPARWYQAAPRTWNWS